MILLIDVDFDNHFDLILKQDFDLILKLDEDNDDPSKPSHCFTNAP